MMNDYNIKERGFTLIETFVAVLILVFAVIGPLGLLSKAIADGNYAKNQVTAYYLAQEAVELFINQRDRNLAEGSSDWAEPFDDCSESNPCRVHFDGELIVEHCDGEGCKLYINSNNMYSHGVNSNPSIFNRYVYLSSFPERENISANLTAVVKWTNKKQEADFTLTTQVFNSNYEL